MGPPQHRGARATTPHVTALEAYYASLRDAALVAAAGYRDQASAAARHGFAREAQHLERGARRHAAQADLTEVRRAQAADWGLRSRPAP